MAIITLSRGTFAGGEELTRLLGERLGYRMVSREDLYQVITRDFGFTAEELHRIMRQAPFRLDRSASRRRLLFAAIQASLCSLVRDDNVIYHGHAGHLLLPGIDHVVRVRLIAPLAKRIQMAVVREGLSAHEAAEKIEQVDAERASWTQFVFGANWADPALYDLVVNLERLNLDQVTELVCATARLSPFCTTAASRQRIEDLALSMQVMARVLGDPAMESLDLRVDARAGRVSIGGELEGRQLERAMALARKVQGVLEVRRAGEYRDLDEESNDDP